MKEFEQDDLIKVVRADKALRKEISKYKIVCFSTMDGGEYYQIKYRHWFIFSSWVLTTSSYWDDSDTPKRYETLKQAKNDVKELVKNKAKYTVVKKKGYGGFMFE